MTEQINNGDNLDSPPFFKKWSGMYWLLIVTLALLVILFHLFSVHFS